MPKGKRQEKPAEARERNKLWHIWASELVRYNTELETAILEWQKGYRDSV